jgi:S1-C subfamily serine protease
MGRDRYGRIFLRDVIVALDGKKVKSYDDLYAALEDRKIGEVVSLTVSRDDRTRQVRLILVQSD